jgi:hypothetical protein
MQFKSSSIVRSFVSLTFIAAGGHALAADPVPATSSPGGSTMYRCPGNEYNNTLSAKEAKDKGCKTIEGAPITVIQSTRPRATPSVAGPAGSKVDPADQRARDADARRILEGELRREEDRLVSMKSEFNNGEPERQGNEKNYQKYLDRVNDMKAAIARKESDIAALKREIAKQQ